MHKRAPQNRTLNAHVNTHHNLFKKDVVFKPVSSC